MKKSVLNKLILTMILVSILCVDTVFAADCTGLLTTEAADLIAEVIGYVRIGVPILLIVLCASDLITVVTSQEDNAVKKASSRIVKRFIAAAAFFFVPLIVQVVLSIDAIKNSLNLVDDPTCGIPVDE